MAAYIDRTYVAARLGEDVTATIEALDGFDLDTCIADSTDYVRGLARKDGYTPADTEDPSEVADGTLRLAVWALVRVEIAGLPDVNIPLPEEWDKSPAAMALADLRAGQVNLHPDVPESTVSGHGGFKFTGTSSTVTGDAPPRTTREELEGY